jgi:hypothetical protein
MKCVEEDCHGGIDLTEGILIQTGCRCSDVAYPCNVCGRLHFLTGDEVKKFPVGVESRDGSKAYLIDCAVICK